LSSRRESFAPSCSSRSALMRFRRSSADCAGMPLRVSRMMSRSTRRLGDSGARVAPAPRANSSVSASCSALSTPLSSPASSVASLSLASASSTALRAAARRGRNEMGDGEADSTPTRTRLARLAETGDASGVRLPIRFFDGARRRARRAATVLFVAGAPARRRVARMRRGTTIGVAQCAPRGSGRQCERGIHTGCSSEQSGRSATTGFVVAALSCPA
jgi:hypothetical protein